MSLWGWIGVGVGAALATSLLVGLAIARILGTIGDEITELFDAEPWASAALTRETEETAETPARQAAQVHVGRRSGSPRR
jgi:hypothetical protein